MKNNHRSGSPAMPQSSLCSLPSLPDICWDSKPQILRYRRRILLPNPSFCEKLKIFLCFSAFPLRMSNFFCTFAPDLFGRDRASTYERTYGAQDTEQYHKYNMIDYGATLVVICQKHTIRTKKKIDIHCMVQLTC